MKRIWKFKEWKSWTREWKVNLKLLGAVAMVALLFFLISQTEISKDEGRKSTNLEPDELTMLYFKVC